MYARTFLVEDYRYIGCVLLVITACLAAPAWPAGGYALNDNMLVPFVTACCLQCDDAMGWQRLLDSIGKGTATLRQVVSGWKIARYCSMRRNLNKSVLRLPIKSWVAWVIALSQMSGLGRE